MVISLVHFLLVMTIPVVGGWFLYSELKWGKYRDKSVRYGCLWALMVCVLLLVESEARLVGRVVDRFTIDPGYETIEFVAPRDKGLEAMAKIFDWMLDIDKRCIPFLLKQEPRPLGHEVWNVIYYIPGKKDFKKDLDVGRFLKLRETPVMKAKLPCHQ